MSTPENREGLAELPPVAPGDVPADTSMWGAERDPADNWGVDHGKLASVADSPHWAEIQT